MIPRRLQQQWANPSEICVFCSTLRYAARLATYERKTLPAVRRRRLHVSSSFQSPPAEAIAESSDTSARAEPAPPAPAKSRFGGFASNKSTPLHRPSDDENRTQDGSRSIFRPPQRLDSDVDFGNEREKGAFRARQMNNFTSRSTLRQLPTLDDPRHRPPRPGVVSGYKQRDAANERREHARTQYQLGSTQPQTSAGRERDRHWVGRDSWAPLRETARSQNTIDDFDLQERDALRKHVPLPDREGSATNTSQSQSDRTSDPGPNWRSLGQNTGRLQSQAESFASNVNGGGFKFGLDDAKKTATAPRESKAELGTAAPWGQHLRKRRNEKPVPDGGVNQAATGDESPTGIRQRLRDDPRSRTSREPHRDLNSRFRGVRDDYKPRADHNAQRDAFSRNRGLPLTNDSDDVVRIEPGLESNSNRRRGADTVRSEEQGQPEVLPDASTGRDLAERARRGSRRRELVADDEEEEAKDAFNSSLRGRDKKQSRRATKFVDEENEDDEFDEDYVPKKERKTKRKAKKETADDDGLRLTPIDIPPFISVQNLATALKIRPEEFVQKLEGLGFEQTAMDHVLNGESAGLVAMEFGYEPIIDRSATEDLLPRSLPEDTTNLPARPPVVTIMGHVDHGKTTLLDYLRKSSMAASEHGGITQHIGAFSVPIASADNRLVTFLDTPGHAAFLSMRQRGANVTDIVVLVVAADDSVKPQTIEAIRHAKNSGVQIIVAISKVDKDDADVQRVKQDLIQHDIEVEDFGGSIQSIEVSGKTGQGIPDLEEAIITLADVLEVRAEAEGAPEGWVLEAATKRAGRSATVLVRRGTMRPGDVLVAGTTWTRVRNLRNEAGVSISEATPGMPVEVDGWRDQPGAGDEVLGAISESKATSVVAFRQDRAERLKSSSDMEIINETRRLDAERRTREKEAADQAVELARAEQGVKGKDIKEAARAAKEQVNDNARKAAPGKVPTIYLLVKADVSGSTEAVTAMINALSLGGHQVAVDILREGVGLVSESDVAHVAAVPAEHGYIVNFNQHMPAAMASLAEKNGVRVIDETIIYKVIDEVKTAVEEWLPPLITSRVVGEAEAAQVFEIKDRRKSSKVAGCRVKNGSVARNNLVRVYRGGIGAEGTLVFEGKLASLRSQKKDVTEMRKGTECGLSFEGWDSFEVGDMIQCYEEKSERRKLA